MNLRRIWWGLGGLLLFFSATFIVPIIIAFIYDLHSGTSYASTAYLPFTDIDSHVPKTAITFLIGGLITATFGLVLQMIGGEQDHLRPREGYAIVGIGWLLIAAFGSLPYIWLGGLASPVDAFFESMSGFTTTGATVLPRSLETYAPSLMIWRAFQQWIGGMGIIVLGVALLSNLTGGHALMSAETPGLNVERIKPRIVHTAQTLWKVYAGYTALLWIVLTLVIHYTGVRLPAKEAIYEGLLHTFTTMSSGGFSNHDESIAYFDSLWVDIVVIVAMFLVGLNFTRHYLMIENRSAKPFLGDPETRFYTLIVVGTSVFITAVLFLFGTEPHFGQALRVATLQSVSIITTTGFTTAVFDDWPDSARLVLLFMFFTGGAAGSTAGGMKVIRILVLMKLVQREVRRLLHPRAVVPVRIGRTVLPDDTLKTVAVFFFVYVSLFIFSTILFTLMGLDMISAISAAASTLGNIGPGLGSVHFSYADVPVFGKFWMALLMWAGRLELFTTLILFFPATWRR